MCASNFLTFNEATPSTPQANVQLPRKMHPQFPVVTQIWNSRHLNFVPAEYQFKNSNNKQQQRNKQTNKKTPCKTPPKTTPRKQMGDHAIVHIIYKIAEKKQIRRPWKIQHYINRNKQRRASVLKGGGRNVIALSLTVLVTLCTYQECILLSNIYHFWRSQVFLLQKDFSKCP